MTSWDDWFMGMARKASEKSKDPSTKVGAVIAGKDNRFISLGFNGFARGCDDSPEIYQNRDRKYLRVLHAETNAILFSKCDLEGCKIYTWPFPPCSRCAAMIIQVGIKQVYCPMASPELAERWASDLSEAGNQFREAGVLVEYLQ